MFVLGFQASPRYNGNTNLLLTSFLNKIESFGVKTIKLDVCKLNIKPCIGCNYCEKEGVCHFKDDMNPYVYSLIKQADFIVAATPIYFYTTNSQFKALIDRTQALWSRKYIMNLKDPGHSSKNGFLLSLGATKGKNLFEGIILTTKYFFDAISCKYSGCLTYRHIEKIGDMGKNKDFENDIDQTIDELFKPLIMRKKVLFVCKENACRSQMANAFAKSISGKIIVSNCAGSEPALNINENMVSVMQEKGFDMAYIKPKSINEAIETASPDYIVTMGCGEVCPTLPGVKHINWDIDDPSGKSVEYMRQIRDKIENKVIKLIDEL